MTRLLIIFLCILAGFLLGPLLQNQQGYVYMEFGQYQITTSMTVFVPLLALIFFTLYVCIRLIRKFFRLATTSGDWFARKTVNRSSKKTDLAHRKVLEGDYQTAAKLLSRSAKSSRRPAIHYLQAAEAAQYNGDILQANELLEQAAQVCTDADKFAFDIVRTRLLIDNKEAQAAKSSVDNLLKQKPRHPEVLRLAEKAYLLAGDYQMLIELLPVFYKVGIHEDEHLDELAQTVYLRQIRKMAQSGKEALINWWEQQPRTVRLTPIYQHEVAQHLITLGDQDAAQQIIYTGLKHQFDPNLISLIAELDSAHLGKLTKLLHKMMQNDNGQSPLNTALLNRTKAKLHIKSEEWHVAAEEIAKAIAAHPVAEDYELQKVISAHLQS